MKKVSIIVPIYNSEKYLTSCLESIVRQTYNNIEIILVNDGSKDKSMDICEEWQKEDKRIKLFNNLNKGVSYSRNYAIERSTGDYLIFIDSDDIISIDFVEELVNNLEIYDAECSICGIKTFYKENEISSSNKDEKKIFNKRKKEKLFNLYGGFLANKLYKKEIINKFNLRLDEEIYVSEDLLFNINYFSKIKKVVYSYKENYYYRQYKDSSYNNLYNKKWFTILDTYKKIIEIEKNSNIELKRVIYYNFGMILAEAVYRLNYFNNIEDIKRKTYNLVKLYFKSKEFKKIKLKNKIKILIFFKFPNIVMARRKK